MFAAVFSVNAAAPPRGADRLRELVVFPEMNIGFNFGMSSQGDETVVNKNLDLPTEISRLRGELKQHPNDIKQLLQFGNLLDNNNQTNESQSCYQKAEQLCRDKAAVNPQDGLNLTDLGEALSELGKEDEAESVYRKATLISSNDWRCWVRRGNFLAKEYYFLLFPENLRSQIIPTQPPPQGVLDYRPTADALAKSEAFCNEASWCFDRAMALAPKEPDVFFQRAGYMSISNWQNCFFRYYRDNEKIDSSVWLLAFFSKETIANLQKAAELSPQNYDYISLAAYFEWFNAMIQVAPKNYTPDILPDATHRSLRDAMIRLETLSQNSDKKLAAGALERLGILNMFFGNSKAATGNFRQAVSLDPTREQSWDMLLGSIADSGTPEEKIAACELRLKYKDSARNHLLLARAFEHQKKWDKAGEQSEAALKLEPNNIIAHLELLALCLKQSSNPKYLTIANQDMSSASTNAVSQMSMDEELKRAREILLNTSIFMGLSNQPEQAKELLKTSVLKTNPNDEIAKEIMNALE